MGKVDSGVPSLARIIKQAESLQLLFSQRTDQGKSLDWVIDHTKLVLQVFKKANKAAVEEVVRVSFQNPLSDVEKNRLAYFLAANEANLNRGVVVLPGYEPPTDKPQMCHWQLTEISRPNDNHRYRVTLQGLSGFAALCSFQESWSEGRFRVVGRSCGMTPPWGKFPYKHRDDMLGFMFVAHTTREMRYGRRDFKLQDMFCNSASLKQNQDLLRVRRREGAECLRGFDFPCEACTFGLDDCPAAVRARTLQLATCESCAGTFWQDPVTRFRVGEPCACRKAKQDGDGDS